MPADDEAILDVCGEALGWSNPEFDRALFRWKHFENAFGPSLILVADDGSNLLAVRPFMQWEFDDGQRRVTAARAVDTATLPAAQGRGLFTALTRSGLDQLETRGVGLVFNTPNDKSLPGYLKMGWVDAGGIDFGFRPRSIARVPRIVRSRTAAAKPSIPTPHLGIGVDAGLEALGPDLDVSSSAEAGLLRTAHTRGTLRWRFAAGPITYRWLQVDEETACIVRLRQRGPSRELVVAHILGDRSGAQTGAAIRTAMRSVNADYCIGPNELHKTVSSTRFGPKLALREVNLRPSEFRFAWEPGDIELF